MDCSNSSTKAPFPPKATREVFKILSPFVIRGTNSHFTSGHAASIASATIFVCTSASLLFRVPIRIVRRFIVVHPLLFLPVFCNNKGIISRVLRDIRGTLVSAAHPPSRSFPPSRQDTLVRRSSRFTSAIFVPDFIKIFVPESFRPSFDRIGTR